MAPAGVVMKELSRRIFFAKPLLLTVAQSKEFAQKASVNDTRWRAWSSYAAASIVLLWGTSNSIAEVQKSQRSAEQQAQVQILPAHVTLYQYESCPYCWKARGALDFFQVPYTVVEVNPITRHELNWSTYKKVPLALFDEEIVADSTTIIERLARAARCTKKLPALNKEQEEKEQKWRTWMDERFQKVLVANLYQSWEETWHSYSTIFARSSWSFPLRDILMLGSALVMWQVGRNMAARYGIEGQVHEELVRLCDEWAEALGPLRPDNVAVFNGGHAPNIADIALYGLLRGVRGTRTFDVIMKNNAMKAWFTSMASLVRNKDNARM